jgi:hypothetical protein
MKIRRETNAHPWSQRMLRRARRLAGVVGVKTHDVHFMEMGGRTWKRIRFQSVSEAAAAEASLERIGPSKHFPVAVIRYGNELWLDYVEGAILDPQQHDSDSLLPEFFGDLYRRGSRSVAIHDTPLPARLQRDLQFLGEIGVLGAGIVTKLLERATSLQPDLIWIGFDYIDPLPKNFVVRVDHLVGVDIEALQDSLPLGTGPAKALLRWCRQPREDLLDRLRDAGAPDLRGQLEYVELLFRSAYAKQKCFQRKTHLAPPAIFDRFLG